MSDAVQVFVQVFVFVRVFVVPEAVVQVLVVSVLVLKMDGSVWVVEGGALPLVAGGTGRRLPM